MFSLRTYVTYIITLTITLLSTCVVHADILFVGGEDSELACIGSCSSVTSNGYFNSAHARLALQAANGSSFWQTPIFTPSSDFWIHANFYFYGADYGYNAASNWSVLNVLDNSGNIRLMIRQVASGSAGQYRISKKSTSGAITDLASMSVGCWSVGKLNPMDVHITYSVSGGVDLYCKGTIMASYSGDVTTDGVTALAMAQFSGNYSQYGDVQSGNWSEIIVATTNTIDMSLFTLVPSTTGATNTCTGSVTDINEQTVNDASGNNCSSGQEMLYTLTGGPTGLTNIGEVCLSPRVAVGTSGPQHFQGVVHIGSTDYYTSDLSPNQSALSLTPACWITNPATGTNWIPGDITGLQLGFKATP